MLTRLRYSVTPNNADWASDQLGDSARQRRPRRYVLTEMLLGRTPNYPPREAQLHCLQTASDVAPPERARRTTGARNSAMVELSRRSFPSKGGGATAALMVSAVGHAAVAATAVAAEPHRLEELGELAAGQYGLLFDPGCRYFTMACPFLVPRFEWNSPNPSIRKCEMCHDRLAEGKAPKAARRRRRCFEARSRQRWASRTGGAR